MKNKYEGTTIMRKAQRMMKYYMDVYASTQINAGILKNDVSSTFILGV
jgi:hypothetical protein